MFPVPQIQLVDIFLLALHQSAKLEDLFEQLPLGILHGVDVHLAPMLTLGMLLHAYQEVRYLPWAFYHS